MLIFFLFKQKTAYEMRISDWSSDVCSSDLAGGRADFLKIDVEGHDLAVMQGGARTLERVLALRVEVQFDDSFGSQTASSIFAHLIDELGRASCRERVCLYV